MSQPWFKFYPSAWRADPALRMCSIGARGLWMEMVCIMHEAEPRGSLLINGHKVDGKQLASLAGTPFKETLLLLGELAGAGVFSREADGTIYSRRMRREDEKAVRDKANGRLGGNPLIAKGVNPDPNPEVGNEPNPNLVSSISLASSVTPLKQGARFESVAPARESLPRGSRLPPDWQPSPKDLEFAATWLRADQIQTQVDSFRDYWNGRAGGGAVKLDWPGTWRNWCRKAAETPEKVRNHGTTRQGGKPVSAITAALDAQLERLQQRPAGDGDEVCPPPARLLSNR